MATIVVKNSSTASAVPGSGDLVQGELAVNVTDKKIYTKDSGGNIVDLTPVQTIFNASTNQTIGTMTSGTHVRLGPFTVTGAQLGDFVDVSASINLSGVSLFGYVSAVNGVSLVWENNSGSSVTLGAATYYIRCIKR